MSERAVDWATLIATHPDLRRIWDAETHAGMAASRARRLADEAEAKHAAATARRHSWLRDLRERTRHAIDDDARADEIRARFESTP